MEIILKNLMVSILELAEGFMIIIIKKHECYLEKKNLMVSVLGASLQRGRVLWAAPWEKPSQPLKTIGSRRKMMTVFCGYDDDDGYDDDHHHYMMVRPLLKNLMFAK